MMRGFVSKKQAKVEKKKAIQNMKPEVEEIKQTLVASAASVFQRETFDPVIYSLKDKALDYEADFKKIAENYFPYAVGTTGFGILLWIMNPPVFTLAPQILTISGGAVCVAFMMAFRSKSFLGIQDHTILEMRLSPDSKLITFTYCQSDPKSITVPVSTLTSRVEINHLESSGVEVRFKLYDPETMAIHDMKLNDDVKMTRRYEVVRNVDAMRKVIFGN